MDAYLEFLNENAERNFPFLENASLQETSGPFVLSSRIVLDARGFTRVANPQPVVLAAVLGPGASSIGGYDSVPDAVTFVFTAGVLVFRFEVPEGLERYDGRSFIADPLFPAYGAYSAGLNVTFGDVSGITGGHLFNIPLEEVIVDLFPNTVHSVQIIKESGPDQLVSPGNIVFAGEFNFKVSNPEVDQEINLSPSTLSGQEGEFLNSLTAPENNVCKDGLFSINGSGTTNGDFVIEGDNNFIIENIPSENKIRITVTPNDIENKVC